jgi:O-antigen ligase
MNKTIMQLYQAFKPNTLRALVIICVFVFPIMYMVIRHSVHVILFTLLLLSVFYFSKNCRFITLKPDKSLILNLILAFSSLTLATLISQIMRLNFYSPSFDGPIRILIAGIVFIYLRKLKISYIRILEVSIPLGLITLLVVVKLNSSAYWINRFATYFVDPNTLGSQASIFSVITFLSLRYSSGKSIYLLVLKIIGGLAGVYISIFAGSRGGWISAIFIIFAALILMVSEVNQNKNNSILKKIRQIIIFLSIVLITGLGLIFLFDSLVSRTISGVYEISNWFSGDFIDSSAGIRLSIWEISLQFSKNSLLFGFGEKDIASLIIGTTLDIPVNRLAIDTLVHTGPHSDIISKLLSLGLVGLFAYFYTLLLPFFVFLSNRYSDNDDIQQASYMGIYYVVGVFVAGLSNEQLSLKYLCSFYGLMIATLLAQVLYQPTSNSMVGEEDRRKSSV